MGGTRRVYKGSFGARRRTRCSKFPSTFEVARPSFPSHPTTMKTLAIFALCLFAFASAKEEATEDKKEAADPKVPVLPYVGYYYPHYYPGAYYSAGAYKPVSGYSYSYGSYYYPQAPYKYVVPSYHYYP